MRAHAAMMTAQHALKVAVFGLLGFVFGQRLMPVAAMAAAGFLGALAGRAVLTRTPDARFRLILAAILCALGARLIWAGMWDLTGP